MKRLEGQAGMVDMVLIAVVLAAAIGIVGYVTYQQAQIKKAQDAAASGVIVSSRSKKTATATACRDTFTAMNIRESTAFNTRAGLSRKIIHYSELKSGQMQNDAIYITDDQYCKDTALSVKGVEGIYGPAISSLKFYPSPGSGRRLIYIFTIVVDPNPDFNINESRFTNVVDANPDYIIDESGKIIGSNMANKASNLPAECRKGSLCRVEFSGWIGPSQIGLTVWAASSKYRVLIDAATGAFVGSPQKL